MAVTDIALRSIFEQYAESVPFSTEQLMTPASFEAFVQVVPELLADGFTQDMAMEVFLLAAPPSNQTIGFQDFANLLSLVAQARYPEEDEGVAYAHFLAMHVFRIPGIFIGSSSTPRAPAPFGSPRPGAAAGGVGAGAGLGGGGYSDRYLGSASASASAAGAVAGLRPRLTSPPRSPDKRPPPASASSVLDAGVEGGFEAGGEEYFSSGIAAIGLGRHPAQLAALQQLEESRIQAEQQALTAAQRRVFSPRPIVSPPQGHGHGHGHQTFAFASGADRTPHTHLHSPSPGQDEGGAGAGSASGAGHHHHHHHNRSGAGASASGLHHSGGSSSPREMAASHRLMTALDRVALRQRTKVMYAAFLALAMHARAAAEAAAKERQDAAGRVERERQEAEERDRRATEERMRREAAEVAKRAADIAAAAARESAREAATVAAKGRSSLWMLGSTLGTLLVAVLVGWLLTLVAVTSVADALQGHCEVIAWWQEYAVSHGYSVPQAVLSAEAAADPARVTSALEWRVDSGCLHAWGWRTPVCVSAQCITAAFAPPPAELVDACTNPYGCGPVAV